LYLHLFLLVNLKKKTEDAQTFLFNRIDLVLVVNSLPKLQIFYPFCFYTIRSRLINYIWTRLIAWTMSTAWTYKFSMSRTKIELITSVRFRDKKRTRLSCSLTCELHQQNSVEYQWFLWLISTCCSLSYSTVIKHIWH